MTAHHPSPALVAGILIFAAAWVLRLFDIVGDGVFFGLIIGSIISALFRKLDRIEKNTRGNSVATDPFRPPEHPANTPRTTEK